MTTGSLRLVSEGKSLRSTTNSSINNMQHLAYHFICWPAFFQYAQFLYTVISNQRCHVYMYITILMTCNYDVNNV